MQKRTKKKKVIKKAKNKKKKTHGELRGLFFISMSLLILISLLSFSQDYHHLNYLGSIGHSLALGLNYFFGVGSYLIVMFLLWLGWKLLSQKQIEHFSFKMFCFSLIIFSFCIVANVFAEVFPEQINYFYDKIYVERILVHFPFVKTYTRYNLGGVPAYYLYKDLPLFNLQKLLSNIGVSLTFSIAGFISFILLTRIKVQPNIESFFLFLPRFFKRLFLFSFTVLKEICFFISKVTKAIFRTSKKALEKKKLKTKQTNIKINQFKPPYANTNIRSKIVSPPKQSLLKKLTPKRKEIKIKKALFSSKSNLSSYELPMTNLLTNSPKMDQPTLKKELERQSNILYDTLLSFGIKARVGNIHCGPTITSFEVHPSVGVKVQKIKALSNDIALNMQAKSIRIIAPIPGKAAVGVEIPSLYPQKVSLKEMLEYYRSFSQKKYNIPLLLGKSVSGEHVISDLSKMPHLLIAGATGAGKSVCINSIVMSMIMNAPPEDIKLILIDPKKVELTGYSNLPHMIAPVITEPQGAYSALQWLVKEMKKRYDILKQTKFRNITSFNSRKIDKNYEKSLEVEIPEKMPFIVTIIDEFADLMMVSSTDLETPIARIAQMARAVGIHLILATQRPSREVITGIIKANFPCRIAFKVSSRVNSQIILDESGADSLLGNGDLLFLPPGTSHLIRAQGSFISDNDINKTIDMICKKTPVNYIVPSFDKMKLMSLTNNNNNKDALYEKAMFTVVEAKNASTTFLQRKLKIGYARAASLMDELEDNGIIGPPEGSRPRQILITQRDLDSILEEDRI
jgi:DNA segregation ATPase FtsK/SpoIIIE, S-DNA-T family